MNALGLRGYSMLFFEHLRQPGASYGFAELQCAFQLQVTVVCTDQLTLSCWVEGDLVPSDLHVISGRNVQTFENDLHVH